MLLQVIRRNFDIRFDLFLNNLFELTIVAVSYQPGRRAVSVNMNMPNPNEYVPTISISLVPICAYLYLSLYSAHRPGRS